MRWRSPRSGSLLELADSLSLQIDCPCTPPLPSLYPSRILREKSHSSPRPPAGLRFPCGGWAMALSVQRSALIAGLLALVFTVTLPTARATPPVRPVPFNLPPADPDPNATVAETRPANPPAPTVTTGTVEPSHDPHVTDHGAMNDHGGESGALIATGDFLLLRPRRRAQDFAILGTNPFWGPQGTIQNVEGGFDAGLRVGAGWRCPGECWRIDLIYTNIHSAGDGTAFGTTNLAVFPTLTHPAVVGQVNAAFANNSVNLNIFDLQVGRDLHHGESSSFRVFAGPRFADLDQKFTAFYFGG